MRQGKSEDSDGNKLEVEDSDKSDEDESNSTVDASEERKQEGDDAGGEFAHKKKVKTKKEIEEEALESDYYKILGLEHNHDATEKEINKAYKKITLKYHPDKVAARGDILSEDDKEIWLKIQKGYKTLTDEGKRRTYDSSLPFDDKIPKEEDIKDPKKFYVFFNTCFKRNAKFAATKPVPEIGDENTPIAEVFKFYKYWDQFKTWREFN